MDHCNNRMRFGECALSTAFFERPDLNPEKISRCTGIKNWVAIKSPLNHHKKSPLSWTCPGLYTPSFVWFRATAKPVVKPVVKPTGETGNSSPEACGSMNFMMEVDWGNRSTFLANKYKINSDKLWYLPHDKNHKHIPNTYQNHPKPSKTDILCRCFVRKVRRNRGALRSAAGMSNSPLVLNSRRPDWETACIVLRKAIPYG